MLGCPNEMRVKEPKATESCGCFVSRNYSVTLGLFFNNHFVYFMC